MRIVSCTRAEAEAELANIVRGCLGCEALKWAALDGLNELAAGSPGSVQVGHTTYRIQEACPGSSGWSDRARNTEREVAG